MLTIHYNLTYIHQFPYGQLNDLLVKMDNKSYNLETMILASVFQHVEKIKI